MLNRISSVWNWFKIVVQKLNCVPSSPTCTKPRVRRSNIVTDYGDRYEIKRVYENLVNKENIHITSVSITRVDNEGQRGYVNNYMIAVSYDYYA